MRERRGARQGTKGLTPGLTGLESILSDSEEEPWPETAINRKLSHLELLIERSGSHFRSCHSVSKHQTTCLETEGVLEGDVSAYHVTG